MAFHGYHSVSPTNFPTYMANLLRFCQPLFATVFVSALFNPKACARRLVTVYSYDGGQRWSRTTRVTRQLIYSQSRYPYGISTHNVQVLKVTCKPWQEQYDLNAYNLFWRQVCYHYTIFLWSGEWDLNPQNTAFEAATYANSVITRYNVQASTFATASAWALYRPTLKRFRYSVFTTIDISNTRGPILSPLSHLGK